jgi:integration host factor subunit beta
MTKQELIGRVTEKVAGIKRDDAEEVINTLFDALSHALTVRGDRVEIRGFGSFRVSERKEREGRNPKTGETIRIPARRVIQFRAGKQLSHIINEEAPGPIG